MKSKFGKRTQLSEQTRKRITKASAFLFVLLSLLVLLGWPSFTAAMPITAQQQFERVWQQVQDVGRYQFNVSALQTTHPTPRIENVGRGPEQALITANGLVNMPEEQMELNLWSDNRPLMVRLVDGSAYGRADVDDEWVELEDPNLIFAPGNDVTGFASAAVHIEEVENWQETVELDAVTAVRTTEAATLYTFDVSGPLFAQFMRQQAETQMQSDGELLPGMELGLAQQYVDMTGHGQLWVNEAGLPVYQVIHLEFPPDRGATERVEADITTEFSGWDSSTVSHGFFSAIPRLLDDPSILQTDPLSLLPNMPSIAPQTMQTYGINLGLILLLAALGIWVVANRRSRKLYPIIAITVIFSTLFTPLLQASQVHAFSVRQQAKYAEQEAAQAQQQALDELNGENSEFNPTVDPLAGSDVSAPAAINQGLAALSASSQFTQPESAPSLNALQTICDLTDSDADCDGDGLANGVEIYRLGTDPEDIDSDGDQISDGIEVAGFNNGTQWYMNPLDGDTNNDGLIDLYECFERIDVGSDGEFNGTDVSNIDCPDTDGDGAPDVFDYDNDGDGVPDVADASPNFVGDIVDNPRDALNINMDSYTTDSTLIVEYQIRPDNPDHLWQTGNSFNWPNDKEGQITFVHEHDVTITPMLEITIPAPSENSNNIVGSLPITPTKTINDISVDDTVDTWLDTETLDKYGINVTQSAEDGSLLAYVPLTVVNDPVGDMAVAWSAHMVYRPEVADWGGDHEARVVWFISGKTSYCDVLNMPDVVTFQNRRGQTVEVTDDNRRYEVWCGQNENWITNADSSVLQTYDDQFTVTGMNFTEYNGVDTAVIAQTDALSVTYEDDLWRLTNGLFQSFAQGKVFGTNQNRFNIAEVKNRFDNETADPYANGAPELWGIDNGSFNILVNSSPDLISALDSVGKVHIPQLLNDTYASPVADDVANVIILREQATRSTIIEDNTSVTISGDIVSVDWSNQDSTLHGSVQWGPYSYDGLEWDPANIIDYVDNALEDQLDAALQDSYITAILDPGESINDLANARAGILSLASSYYVGIYQGATSALEINGELFVDTSSSNVDDYLVNDAAINLGANPAFVGVTNETLLLFQELIEEELILDVDGDVVGNPISGNLGKALILETFGSAKNGTPEGDGDDIVISIIEGSKSALKKVGSTFEKKVLKIDLGLNDWAKRAKTAATGLGLLAGLVQFLGPELGLSDGAVVGIQAGLTATGGILIGLNAAAEFHKSTQGVKAVLMKNFLAVRKAARSGAVIGLIVDTLVIVGVAVYTISSQNLEPGSLAFNTIIATAIGQLVVAIISAIIAAIFPIGTIIIAIVDLIDILITATCAVIEEVAGDGSISDDVDKWVCGGISGAIAAGITEAIYDNYLTVDLNAKDRLTISFNEPVVNAPNGYIPGTTVQLSMEVVTKLSLAPIEDGAISRSYTTAQLREKMRRSAFGYYLQTSDIDHHDELNFGSVSWTNNQHTFNPPITLTFNQAGVNQSRDIYFTESYNVVTLECWGFIFVTDLTCDEKATRDSFHDKQDSFVIDIFPSTFDGFVNRGNSSRSFQWFRSATVRDIDGDGLPFGAGDPYYTSPDGDGDGLSDRWELQNGTDPRNQDRDNDGLIDYWEIIFETDPYQKDSDGDGLLDGEEFPHSQAIDPFADDNQPWTGGWLITYDYDASDNPIDTWVWADPLLADSDDDGMPDPTERFYDYNPNVANVLNPVSLVSSFSTNSVQAGVVGIQETINYTATVGNEDQFNTISGQFNVEVPEDYPQVTETIPTLLPEETINFSGVSPVGDITASQYTSVTVRAKVTLDDLVDDVSGNALLHFPLDENVASGVVANDGSLGGQATCDTSGGCPLFGDIGQVLEAANFNLRYGKEIVYPFTDDLEQNVFSMGLWVKPYSGTDPKFMIGREQNSLSLVGYKVQFSLSGNEGTSCGSPTVLVSDTRLNRYQWNHVMATFDGTTMRVYINGELDVNTATHAGGVCTVEDNSFNIGATAVSHMRGLMDEVMFFGSTLDQTQINTLFNYQYFFFDAVQRYPVIVDAEGPENTLNLDTDLPNAPVMLSITSVDDLSIVKAVQVTVTSPSSNVAVIDALQDESESGLWYFMFTPDVEGQYTIDIAALDAVSNIGAEQVFIYVDDSPSVTTIDSSLTSSVLTTNDDSVAEDNHLLLFGGITDNRTLGDDVTIDVLDWLGTPVQAEQITEIVTDTAASGTWAVDYLFPTRAYGIYDVTASSEDFVGNAITETVGTLLLDDYGPWSDVTMTATAVVSGSNTVFGTVNDIHYDNSGRTFHLHLDEAAGATEFVDSTQRKFVASCSGSNCPTAGVSGQYGTAVQFDGNDDRLEIAADDIFTMTNTTLMAWVYPTWSAGANGYNPTILSVDDGTNSNFRWQIADDYSAMLLVTDSGTQSLPITLNSNEWSHVALAMEGGAWTGYVNGISTQPISQTFGTQTGLPFNIGAANASSGHFTGAIDEVVVYSHALLLDEIYDIANPLATTIVELEMQARHLNGAIWPEVDPDGLKMYLPLDDPNGVTDFNHTSLIDEPVSCDDEADGCPTAGVEGAFSSSTAVQFDGDDYIAIPDTEDLDLEEITVSFWVKAPSTSSNDYLITKGRDGWAIRFALPQGDGRILFETPGLQAPNNVFSVVGGPNIMDDQWHHVVAMYDGESKIVYVDGNKVIDQAVTGSLPQSDQPLSLGSTYVNGQFARGIDALEGSLDEVAIFNRALTEDEIQVLYTWETWQPVTLDSPNSFYSTWSTAVPEGLEGLYTIGLRATDSVGNQLTNPEAWTGPIDLRAPRLSFDYISLPDDNVQTTCIADDLNITEDGWVCPAGDPISESKQSSDWFVDYFTAMTRTVGLQSDTVTINTLSDGTYTACDLHNNCRTVTIPKQSVAEGVAILSPVNGTTLTNFDPITISGFAWSDQEIRQVNLLVNGETVDVFQWSYSQGATKGSWSTTWTPTPGVTEFELEAILLTAEYQGGGFDPANAGVFIDESDTILAAPTIFVDKSVTPELAEPGETVTYTVVVGNNGLNSLQNVSIVDTLPAGVTPLTGTSDISDTVDIPVGESVSYTIPVTVDAGQTEDIINTVSVSHVTFDDQDSAVLALCDEVAVVTSPFYNGSGTFQEALTNVCEGGTITFASDLSVGINFFPDATSYVIDKAVTIDGGGFDVMLDASGAIGTYIEILDGVGPVIFSNVNILKDPTQGGVEGVVSDITVIDAGVGSEVFFMDVGMDIGNPEDTLLVINDGEMTFNNSQVWGGVATNQVFGNSGTLTFQNSTVDAAIDNSGDLTVDYSTLFAENRANFEEFPSSGGIINTGTVKLNGTIMVTSDADCGGAGAYEDLGYNIFATGGTCPATATSTQTIDPTLLFTDVMTSMADNGGNTLTYALLPSSSALDVIARGENDCGVAIANDQRGIGRPQNAMCDIGAYEVINNIPPVSVDDAATTDEEITVTIDVLANDSDADFDILTVTSVSQPASGTAVIVNNGTDTQFIEYTPNVGFEGGSDTFTYNISDGAGGTATATVVVTVNAVNDIPNAVDDIVNTVENTAVVINVLANDIDENSLSLVSVTQPVSGTAVINGSQIVYTPPTGFLGTEIFGYVATDGTDISNFALVQVTVNPAGTNNPPTVSAGDDMNITLPASATLNGIASDDGLPNPPGALTILWTQVSGPGTATFGDAAAAATTASFSAEGVYLLQLAVDDGEFNAFDQVTITVQANSAPTAVDDTATTNENTAVTIDILTNDGDADGDSLTIDSVTNPANGTVVNNGSDVTYTPDADFSGTDSFDYTISDGNGGTDTATVTVTVNAVNDAPVAVDDSAITDEDTAVTIDVLTNDSDADGDSLTIDSVTDPANGTVVNNGSDVTYTPDADFSGTDSFDYTISDGNGGTDTATVSVTVNEVVGVEADLSITMTDDADPSSIEQMLTYTIIVSNNGPVLATGVIVTDFLPVEVEFASVTTSQGSCNEDDDEVTCHLGEIASGATAAITIQVMPEEAGAIVNIAQVVGNEADPDLTNNTASESTTVSDGVSCNGVPATIVGTSGNDVLNGTSGDDVIVGLAGDDIINGNGGNDIICGGRGADVISGGSGQDLLKGGHGADALEGNGGADELRGGRGEDALEGGSGADVLYGGRGNDLLEGNGGPDILRGRRGDDLLLGGSGADELYGGRGNDNLQGGGGADLLDGGRGDDLLLGQSGLDTLKGELGNDDLRGGSGADDLFGGVGYDLLNGNGGNDFCDGGLDLDIGLSCETEVDIP